MKENRKQEGVTLIALVITIIILIILAGVAINALVGENGMIMQAQRAKEETEISEQKEGIVLALAAARISDRQYQKITLQGLQKAIDEQFSANMAKVFTNGSDGFIIQFSNREYEVNGNMVLQIKKVTDKNPGELAGVGTEESPYLIESIEDLIWFAKDVTEGNRYEGKFVRLQESLNFNADSSYVNSKRKGFCGYRNELKESLTSGEGFLPIGTADNIQQNNYSFWGVLDGNGKSISNLYMNKHVSDNVNDVRIGLFGNNYGIIKNLAICDCNINASLNSTAQNTIMVGGIVGYNYGIIEKSYVDGKLSAEGKGIAQCRVAGIAGQVGKSEMLESGMIRNSYNKANVICKGNNVNRAGGIVANAMKETKVEYCYNLGQIQVIGNGISEAGGICASSLEQFLCNNVYNCGNVTIKEETGNNGTTAGGIIGNLNTSTLNNAHNIGKVVIESPNTFYLGGIVGFNNKAEQIAEVYYLASTASKGIGNLSDNTIRVESKENMKSINSILGVNFKDDSHYINNGYPILDWQ